MKKNLSAISLIVLSLVNSCASPINNSKALTDNHITSKHNLNTTISGKAEFPSSNKKLSIKATLAEIGVNATVSVIYPSEHASLANKTIATGLTDANGNFSINPDINFTPALNEIFVLEASKRIGSTGKAVITVRTFIKWNGNTWESITSPTLNINTKTTALASMIELLSPAVNANDSIGKILVSGNISTPSDIKHLNTGSVIIKADSINKVANLLLDYTLANNQDPLEYLVYQNGQFTLRETPIIANKIMTIAGNGSNTFLGDNEQNTNTKLHIPRGIVFDSNGNLYIADYFNYRVRKIDKLTGIVSTIAGTEVSDYNGDGGEASRSNLAPPNSIDIDSNGNIYIAEAFKIRKVDKLTGVISTIAGNGTQGFSGDGGQATNAQLNNVNEIEVDSNDNLYIVDSGNNRIRKIDKLNGVINTIAGGGSILNDGGQATNAQLSYPMEVVFDSNENLYIADGTRIRKVDKLTGVINTVAGGGSVLNDGGQATNAQLNSPNGISFDSNGNMYIADTNNQRIRKVDKTTGVITTVVGTGTSGFSGDNGQATLAQLSYPKSIIFDSNGNLYFSDYGNSRIRKIDTTTGIISTFVGGGIGNNITATNTIISSTESIITLDNTGNLYIADTSSSKIRKVDAITGIINTIVGTGTSGFSGDNGQASLAQLNAPNGISVDSNGNLYFSDSNNHRIRKVDKLTGIISTIAGTGIAGLSGDNGQASLAQVSSPNGIAFDNNGNLYFSDYGNSRIRKIDKLTGIISTFTSTYQPKKIVVDSNNNIYIADTSNHKILKVDGITKVTSTLAGTGTLGYSGDGGQATNAQLNTPIGVSCDSFGNIYFSDSGNHRIRKVDKLTGIISTVIGTGISGYLGNMSQASNAQLNTPNEIALDSNGNLYIADSGNKRIRKVNLIPSIQP